MLFKRKKKEEPHKGDVFLAKGIYLKKPELDNGNIVLNCFLRSLIVFLLVFGSIGGFLSAFDISCNLGLVILFYLLLSTYFSFLYAAPKMLYRDLGYILFFGIFVGAIYLLRIYANSGFYVIVNRVLKRAQSFFELSGVREYEVQVNNDYLSVAVVAIFIGMVIIIILNIWMYSTMSLAWTILFTFPVLLIPLYMMLTPGFLYLIALIVGYLAVAVFKANGHFVVFAWDKPFRVRGIKKDRITYTQDAGIFRQVLVSLGLLLLCMVVFVELLMPPVRFQASFKEDKFRDRTQEIIGNFILLGFEGMYNHYQSTGGMSGGKLGGVSSVRPDYQPDLIVSYAPYSADAVYLKAYTGGRYGENRWESLYGTPESPETNGLYAKNQDDVSIFEEESLHKEAVSLQKLQASDVYGATGKMDVRNVGADISYLYYPYYTEFKDYTIYRNHSLMTTSQGLLMQQMAEYTYYPKVVWEDALLNVVPADMDVSQVDGVFLEVPDKNKAVIQGECDRIGLHDGMTEKEITDSVRDYFQENIPYTLKPGATPQNKDFVNYFLTKNRKGYCAHFASAATLMFRQMGIPARYVEGYVIPYETALASDLNEEKEYTDFYRGYSAIGESAVLDVEVTDAMAHAWVEVYVDGFGWKVVEVTPSSDEQEEETDNFWDAFTSFMNNSALDGTEGRMTGTLKIDLQEYFWLLYVMLGMAALAILIGTGNIGIRKWRRYIKCHQENRTEAVIACYADLCDMLRVCDSSFAYCKSHMEQLRYMGRHYQIQMDYEMVCECLEKISYGREELSDKEYLEVSGLLKQIRKAIWKTALWKQKIELVRR